MNQASGEEMMGTEEGPANSQEKVGCSNGFSPLSEEEESLVKLCDDLAASEEMKKFCLSTFRSVFTNSSSTESTKLSKEELHCCLLYIAQVNWRMPYGPVDRQLEVSYLEPPTFTVTELLQKTNMNMTTLFQKMKVLREIISVGDAVSQHLVALEKKYCIVTALFYTLERVCKAVFRAESKPEIEANSENLMPPMPESEGAPIRKRRCWALFLHAKSSNYLAENQELVQAFHLLLCCLEYVLRSTPSFLLNPPFDTIRIGCPQSSESRSMTMLGKLAEQFKTSLDDVHSMQQNSIEPFLRELPHTDGELDFERLEEEYEAACRREGDLNELLFLDHDPHLLPRAVTSIPDHQSSPTGFAGPLTPVRASLNTIQQLKSILNNAKDEPSAALLGYFKNCATNPLPALRRRLERLRDAFCAAFVEVMTCRQSQRQVAQQRFKMAVSLHFRVMENMLNSEHERLSLMDFGSLLNNEKFHLSLLACSTEVVLVTYSLKWTLASGAAVDNSSFAFPWVLSVFQLQAYDFFKVLESYIKAEPKLTGDIIRHLQNVENRILEEMAWKEGSSLFATINLSEGAQRLPATSTLDLSASPAELYLSPQRVRPATRSATQSQSSGLVNGTPPRPSTSPRQGASQDPPSPDRSQRQPTSLSLFYNKVCRLGYMRLEKLCLALEVPESLLNRIWTCFEYCILSRPGLMMNRHLDQIMMCCIYGVCKAMEREIKFKVIVQQYRELYTPDQTVYKSAFIKKSEYDSIIGLYNKVFMQDMKTFVLQFSSNKQETQSLSPRPKLVSSPKVGSPVYSVPGMKNFYVSPLKSSPFKAPSSPGQMTPRSRQLYCFGESSEKLRSINKSMSNFVHVAGPGRGLKRLVFDMPPPDDRQESLPQKVVKRMTSESREPSLPLGEAAWGEGSSGQLSG